MSVRADRVEITWVSVHINKVWNYVSVYVWTEFRVVIVCVRAERVKDRVSV